jgi:hypothetical protein
MVMLVVEVQLVDQIYFLEFAQSAIDCAQAQARIARSGHMIEIIGTNMVFAVVQQLEQQQALSCDSTTGAAQHFAKSVFDKRMRLL